MGRAGRAKSKGRFLRFSLLNDKQENRQRQGLSSEKAYIPTLGAMRLRRRWGTPLVGAGLVWQGDRECRGGIDASLLRS